MVIGGPIDRQAQRAQAVSLMLPWKGLAELYAERAGVTLTEIEDAPDDLLIGIMSELGFSREDMIGEIPELQAFSPEDQKNLLDQVGFEHWTVENVRRGAREECPLPLGIAVGGVMVDTSRGEDFPCVWAVATPFTDPDAMAKSFIRTCRNTFGKQAFREISQHSPHGKSHAFTPEEMASMHERGMSYREIAIQTLRDEYPEIIGSPDTFKAAITRERARIIKVIRAAHKLWNLRMPDDSIG